MNIKSFLSQASTTSLIVSSIFGFSIFTPATSYACSPDSGYITVASNVTGTGTPQPNLQEECSMGARLVRNYANAHGVSSFSQTVGKNNSWYTPYTSCTSDCASNFSYASNSCTDTFAAWIVGYSGDWTAWYSGNHSPAYNLCP